MIRDAWTVMRKDLLELRALHSRTFTLFAVLSVLLLFGLVFPLLLGVTRLSLPYLTLLSIWLPWPLSADLVSDAFAGERERGTLGTLFVTRLSSTAILLGKVSVVALCAWTLAFLTLVLGATALKSAGVHAPFELSSIFELGAAATVSAILAATAGALTSLRSRSVRQAQRLTLAAALALAGVLVLARPAIQAATAGLSAQPILTLAILLALLLAAELTLFALAGKAIDRLRFGPGCES